MLCLFACGADRGAEDWQAASESGTSGGGSTSNSGSTSSSGIVESGETNAATGDSTTSGAPVTTGQLDVSTTSTTGTTSEVEGSTTGEEGSICGDGIVQDDEECDDPGDIHCYKCYRDRLVFVTSEVFQGDWAKSGIDYWCNHLAAVAGLITDNQFRFKPWISTSGASAADRLFHSPGRYILLNDLVFAESWNDLVAGKILNPLNVTEHSQTHDYPVWTGTAPDGTAIVAPDGDHCDNWTSDSLEKLGYFGYASEIGSDWTLYDEEPTNPAQCAATKSLYCFESP